MKTLFVRTPKFPFWKGEWSGEVLVVEATSVVVSIEGSEYRLPRPPSADDLGAGDRVSGPWLCRGSQQDLTPLLTDDLMPGEEFARWLRDQVQDLPYRLSEPIGEDYGWGFWVNSEKDQFWVALSSVQEAEWGVSVTPERGCNPLAWFRKTDIEKHESLEARIFAALKECPEIEVVREDED